jgi:ligand-binding sensor domain-containing protein
VKNWFRIPGVSLFFIILGAFNLNAQQSPLKFSYLTVDDGLSHTDVKEVKQDKLGFIWIATLYGLDRYDGHEIKRFYNTTVPKNFSFKNRIRSMCLDESDRIWLGSEDGIQFFDPRLEKYTNVDNPEHNTGKKTYSRLIAYRKGLLATIAETRFRLFRINVKGYTLKISSWSQFFRHDTRQSGKYMAGK